MKFHDHITDSELLEQFTSSGSQAAFAALVQRHGAMVRAVAMRVLANHHDAEDVTQAVFIKLAGEAGKLMGQASVASWLHTVSRHLSLNAHKSRESRRKREYATMDQATTTDAGNEEIAIGFRRELDAALARLPERYRQPLVLFHLEGAPLHKCAELLELNPVTLRTRLSRARDMLRSALVRRGIEVASVAGLTALLTVEAKAGTLSPALVASILDTASGGSVAVSPAVLELANTTVKFKSAGISTLILPTLIIMKTKTTATAIAALIIAAISTSVYIAKKPDSSDSANRKPGSASQSSGQARVTKTSVREEQDPLSKMSGEELYALMSSVALISDEAERLAAIREKLGMNISDEVYRKALASFGNNASLKARERFIQSVMESWLVEDPSSVMQWCKRLSGEIRPRLLERSIEAWMKIDSTAAMAWAEKNLEAKELATAREKMTEIQQPHADKLSIADIAGQMLAIEDPVGKNRGEYDELSSRIDSALSALAKDDPQAALDAFRSLDQKVRNKMFLTEGTLYKEFASKDPAAAIALFRDRQPEHNLHTSATMSDLYSIWARKDPDAAIAAAMCLDAGKDRGEALLATLPAWQMKYPEKNIKQAADLSVLDESQYNRLIGQLVENMAITNPAAAAAYAMDVEDVKMQQRFIKKTADVWVRKDSKEAENWVDTLPEGELRDSGLGSVANWVANKDLAHAGRLTKQIKDPDTQNSVIKNIIMGDNISRDFSGTLQLADQLPSIDELSLGILMRFLSPKDADDFEVWLRDANTKGRITYVSEEPAKDFQQMLDQLKTVKAKQQ